MKPPDDLPGTRILVVEDDYFIASDISGALRGCGAQVAGPVPTQEQGLEMLEGTPVDGAVLDINLGGRTSMPVARTLVRRKIPFLFVTGYGRSAIPEEFREAPCLVKPFRRGDLLMLAGAHFLWNK